MINLKYKFIVNLSKATMNSLKNNFKKIDILSHSFSFENEDSQIYKSDHGACLSLFIFILLLAIVLIEGKDVYLREKSSMATSTEVLKENNIYLKDLNINFTLVDLNNNIYNNIEEYLDVVLNELEVDKNKIFRRKNLISYNCSSIEISKKTLSPSTTTNTENINNSCLNFNENTAVKNQFPNTNSNSIVLDFSICHYTDINRRVPCKATSDFISRSPYILYTIGSYYPDNLDYSNPTKYKTDTYTVGISKGLIKRHYLYFSYDFYSTDYGWLLEDHVNIYYLSLNNINKEIDFTSKEQDVIASFYISGFNKRTLNVKHYMKIQDLFATIGGFANAVIFIFKCLFDNYLRHVYLMFIRKESFFTNNNKYNSFTSNKANNNINNRIINNNIHTISNKISISKEDYVKSEAILCNNTDESNNNNYTKTDNRLLVQNNQINYSNENNNYIKELSLRNYINDENDNNGVFDTKNLRSYVNKEKTDVKNNQSPLKSVRSKAFKYSLSLNDQKIFEDNNINNQATKKKSFSTYNINNRSKELFVQAEDNCLKSLNPCDSPKLTNSKTVKFRNKCIYINDNDLSLNEDIENCENNNKSNKDKIHNNEHITNNISNFEFYKSSIGNNDVYMMNKYFSSNYNNNEKNSYIKDSNLLSENNAGISSFLIKLPINTHRNISNDKNKNPNILNHHQSNLDSTSSLNTTDNIPYFDYMKTNILYCCYKKTHKLYIYETNKVKELLNISRFTGFLNNEYKKK